MFFSYGKIKYHSACGFLGLIHVHVITLHVSIYTSFLKDIWLHACITNNYYHHDYADILAMALAYVQLSIAKGDLKLPQLPRYKGPHSHYTVVCRCIIIIDFTTVLSQCQAL